MKKAKVSQATMRQARRNSQLEIIEVPEGVIQRVASPQVFKFLMKYPLWYLVSSSQIQPNQYAQAYRREYGA